MNENLTWKPYFTNSEFEHIAGYARGLRIDNSIWLSGITGYDYSDMSIDESLEVQVIQALKNVDDALNYFGSDKSDIVQCNWVITKAEYFAKVGGLLRNYFGSTTPTMMTLVCELIDSRMKFEIQPMAYVRSDLEV